MSAALLVLLGAAACTAAASSAAELRHPKTGDDDAVECKTHLDCELNGVCRSSVCHCYRGWTGPTCGTLDLLPARRAGAWPATRGCSTEIRRQCPE